ncbi:unnamed protein product [Cyclocybe aegerita]|uniref:G domain-containing protein n=1 Tax=Cyclocybe aegerita TaxID=1973307 RepID=A0A8S0VXL9_CYCAE|nr:unnamed protein product [Cyclocybe aegerita]
MGFFKDFLSKIIPIDSLRSSDVVILIIGPPGVGKTTFINMAAQRTLLDAQKSLSAGTRDISTVRCKDPVSKRSIVLVDTPAYPDEQMPTNEYKIKDWMKKKRKAKISGILYLHRITDNRVTTPPGETYKKFKGGLAGGVDTPVLLVTTMWDHWSRPNISAEQKEKALRVAELRLNQLTEDWKDNVGESVVERHDNTQSSALRILDQLLAAAK